MLVQFKYKLFFHLNALEASGKSTKHRKNFRSSEDNFILANKQAFAHIASECVLSS